MKATSGLLPILLAILFCAPCASLGQSSPLIGDPERDKKAWLLQGNPTIFVKGSCPTPPNDGVTLVGGVLWPTLVQVKQFLTSYVGGTPLCITGGSEPGHSPAHSNGFKVDLRIGNAVNTFPDNLSNFVLGNTTPFLGPDGKGGRKDCRSDGAPWYSATNAVVYAMEYPRPILGAVGYSGPQDCTVRDVNGTDHTQPPSGSDYLSTSRCCHWDIASSFVSITLTSPAFDSGIQSVRMRLGDTSTIVPAALDLTNQEIPALSWMFDYSVVADPDPAIVLVDPTGVVAGTKVGSVPIMVSEGTVFATINVTVDRPNPPDSRTCDVTGPPCWMWDPNGGNGDGAWIWNPGQPTTTNPNPPGPAPSPGQCPGNSTLNVPPTGCWVWDPTANNGGGAWIFIRPQGGGGGTTTLPVTPVGSYDPNDITGLPGVGSERYLTNTSPFTYLIQFENLAAATAPAQQVTVTDALNTANFDLSTVALGPIAFAGQVVTPPAVPLVALGKFSTDLDLRPSTNLIVRVTASLNVQSGVLSWSMTSLDPDTLQPPADPLAGFLPPGADGSVSLIVNAKGSLPSGTTVSDQAFIVFDANPAIATPVWSNTLDSTAPSSAVTALPVTESSANFTVAWQGSDTSSGIQDFAVFASDNRGPFSIWLANTTANSATFFGQWGHTYAFYSIARDRVGNIESTKTTTQVIPDPVPPVSTVTLSPQPNAAGWNNSNVTVNLASLDNPGGTGVKQITYSASGAQTIASITLTGSSASFSISTEGITTITFFAVDNAGNAETPKTITVKLDKTPPTITSVRTPAANANGWNNSQVTISFSCVDTLSGLAAGSPPAPTILANEGANQSVSGTCQDLAGNSAAATVSEINIDKTPPNITCSATPNVLLPPNNKLVPVNATVTVTDSLSGSAGFDLLSVTSNERDSGQGDIQGFVQGTPSVAGQLRAQRLGSGSGRAYTLTYSGADPAGNSATCTTTVTVPHDQGH